MNNNYLDVYNHLKKNITEGIFAPGQILPSENELSNSYGVKRFVIRKVINKLVAEGMVFVIRNEGYFVMDEIINVGIRKNSNYTQNMLNKKLTPHIKIIGITALYPDEELVKLFSLTKDELFWELHILRYYKQIPYLLSRSYIPYGRFPDFGENFRKFKSIYKVFNNIYGFKPVRMKSTCRATISDKKESRHLAIFENSPIIKVSSINTDLSDKPVEYCISTFRSDLVRINVNLKAML